MDHGPPPPYSVTDLYSNSGSRGGSQPHPISTVTTSNFDISSVPGRSVSECDAISSTGDPTIYTPPYTPDGLRLSHLDSAAGSFDYVSSHASAVAASASAYFESRPVHQVSSDVLLVHGINITKHTQPADIPFPEPEQKWLDRDVLPQDWETFVNYLIPHHIDSSNHNVAERKLKEELINERMHRLALDQDDVSRSDLGQVDAQLDPLRRSHTEEGAYPDVNAVIEAWNSGFFAPRNIFIEASEPQFEDSTTAMPNPWMKRFGLGAIRENGWGFGFGGHVPHEHHRGYHPEHHPFHISTTLRGRTSGRGFSSRMPQRDRSQSTSSSSSSSASSIESAGSLPDYDHLKDTQLPIARQAIKDWLNHPDQPITKQTVKQITQEIKAAKCGNSNINGANRDALRIEVRELFKEFKAVKKSQKKAWKTAKRERRSLRREARRNRWAARREMKGADKQTKHAEKEARKAAKQEIKAGKRREPFLPMPEIPAVHIPPGGWPLENEYQRLSHPLFHMPTLSPTHRIPHTGPPIYGRGWQPSENTHAADVARVALLQAEGRRIEAKAKREEALQRAEETRQRSLDQESAARIRAEGNRQEFEDTAGIVREGARTTAALALERAEKQRQRAVANARVARQKGEANRSLADSNRMLADVNRMRMQAQQLPETARLKLLDVAEKLEEEAEKLKREGERLVVEALQYKKDLENELLEAESPDLD